ncbi:mutator family transposase [Micromonospora sp. Llam0]|nr:mutator family transposase [Micromonospora sp. Llam0]
MADKKNPVQLPEPSAAEREFAQQLVERAKADGVSLVGPGGLLAGITRTVLESALDAELDAHLDDAGVDEATGRRVNIRNSHGAKTVRTEVGPVRGSRSPGTGPGRSPRYFSATYTPRPECPTTRARSCKSETARYTVAGLTSYWSASWAVLGSFAPGGSSPLLIFAVSSSAIRR